MVQSNRVISRLQILNRELDGSVLRGNGFFDDRSLWFTGETIGLIINGDENLTLIIPHTFDFNFQIDRLVSRRVCCHGDQTSYQQKWNECLHENELRANPDCGQRLLPFAVLAHDSRGYICAQFAFKLGGLIMENLEIKSDAVKPVKFGDGLKDSSEDGQKSELLESLLRSRLQEMESREQILQALNKIHELRIWRSEGYKSLQAFCIDRLGYDRAEARGLGITLGAILTSQGLQVENPDAQIRVEALREWRKNAARLEGFAAYRIFSNRTLLELASQNPQTLEELRKIKGFGSKRIEAFGAPLVHHLQKLKMAQVHSQMN